MPAQLIQKPVTINSDATNRGCNLPIVAVPDA